MGVSLDSDCALMSCPFGMCLGWYSDGELWAMVTVQDSLCFLPAARGNVFSQVNLRTIFKAGKECQTKHIKEVILHTLFRSWT